MIQGAVVEDSGKYECQAANPYGTIVAEFRLIVQGEELSPKIPIK